MTRLLRAALFTTSLAGLAACGAPPEAVALTASNPALLDSLHSVTFLMFGPAATPDSCQDLIDLPVQGLADRTPQAAQTIAFPDRDDYAFGAIPQPGWHAFVALGSPEALGRGTPLLDLSGHVTAVGCEEAVVEAGKPLELSVQLLPAGLR